MLMQFAVFSCKLQHNTLQTGPKRLRRPTKHEIQIVCNANKAFARTGCGLLQIAAPATVTAAAAAAIPTTVPTRPLHQINLSLRIRIACQRFRQTKWWARVLCAVNCTDITNAQPFPTPNNRETTDQFCLCKREQKRREKSSSSSSSSGGCHRETKQNIIFFFQRTERSGNQTTCAWHM